ncbi:chain length determinant protein EpsF [Duganella sp. BJB488]|uniref:chain length determinant protein EpsF n=1 Tax=unclassified Duganella TaxID=2636909 RepID=UPI000E3483E0|nr:MULTISPECIES: chain length determinant protein EpsF [unclassified Duganella]NVD73921.1 chain length determinant protein EpsF [Duganella sp. BJB1802]RFP12400.1 chain length determinant protein EpsF [Duganella sp. BJB489]RFP16506.1 chain length determinant protein EpsF [Duganella sp. BJB488]RFP30764.1 chain length determinant protein EpsF [Duganella sp. BJB480]
MNLSQFLLILQARKWIILAALFTTVLCTLTVSLMLPKTYKATASVLVNAKGVDPVTGITMPGQLLPGYVATQVDIIGSKNVALRVVDQLGLDKNAAVQEQFKESSGGKGTVRDWLADLLLKKLDIVPARESSVVEISFKGADPVFVAAIANAFADEYQKVSIQLKVEPMKKAAAYFNDQLKLLRDNVEASQARLSKYQQENGIVSVDNRLDVESNRLNDLSAQLVGAQGQLMEASSRAGMASGGQDSPDVAGNPLVQNLKVGLGAAEAKLAELGQRLEHNHPQYQSAKAEVDKLRSDLANAVRTTSNSVGNNAAILRRREAEVRSALEAQKKKVLELNRTRDELNVLAKDVESAQRAFDATSQRFAQTRIESQSEQSDIALLNPAVAPIEPSGPRVVLNTLLSVVLGGFLGLGLALLSEMLDRRVRSEADLAEALDIPVFGVIEWNATKRKPSGLKKLLAPRALRLN